MDARRLRGAQQGANALRVLEGIQHEEECGLLPLDRAGEHVLDGREPALLNDDRDALLPVEAGKRGERAALDLDDRDPQGRRVEDDLLESLTALGRHQQPARRARRREGLLDRSAAGDELLALLEWRGRRARPDGMRGRIRSPRGPGSAPRLLSSTAQRSWAARLAWPTRRTRAAVDPRPSWAIAAGRQLGLVAHGRRRARPPGGETGTAAAAAVPAAVVRVASVGRRPATLAEVIGRAARSARLARSAGGTSEWPATS